MGKVLEEYRKTGVLLRSSETSVVKKGHSVPGTLILPEVPMLLFSTISSGAIISTENLLIEGAFKRDINSHDMSEMAKAKPNNIKKLATLQELKDKILEMNQRRLGPPAEDKSTRGKLRGYASGNINKPAYSERAYLVHNEVKFFFNDPAKQIIGIQLCMLDRQAIQKAFDLEEQLKRDYKLPELEWVTYDTYDGIKPVVEIQALKKLGKSAAIDLLVKVSDYNKKIKDKYLYITPADLLLKHNLQTQAMEVAVGDLLKENIPPEVLLQAAVRCALPAVVNYLLQVEGHRIPPQSIVQAFNSAVAAANKDLIKIFLNYPTHLHKRDEFGLGYANFLPQDSDVLKDIIESSLQETCVHFAIRKKNSNAIAMLLRNPNFNPNEKDPYDQTPLQVAVSCQDWATLEQLVQLQTIDLFVTDKHKRLIFDGVGVDKLDHIVRLFLQCKNFSIEKLNQTHTQVLLRLTDCFPEAKPLVMELIRQGIRLDTHYITGENILFLSIRKAEHEIVDLLFSRLDTKKIIDEAFVLFDGEGLAVLHYVFGQGQIEMLKLLVKWLKKIDEFNLNIVDTETQRSPLHMAVLGGQQKLVQVLLENVNDAPYNEIDINQQDKDGMTPLHHALNNKNREMVELLLKFPGIDTSLVDEQNKTLSDYATATGDIELIKLFPPVIASQTNTTVPVLNKNN